MKGFLNLKILLFLTTSLLFSSDVLCQDFLKIFKDTKARFEKEPIKLSGFISADFGYFGSNDTLQKKSPFPYRLNASVNFDILGVKIPLSINYSGEQVAYNYKLPSYKFVGLSPTYKWATLHIGNRSMNFSQNTLSGKSFRGVGAEIAPGKIKFSTFYGSIEEQRVPQFENGPAQNQQYKRIAYGAKFEFGQKRKWSAIFFNAQDDPFSIDHDSISLPILAKGNTIFSIKNDGKIMNNLSYSFELAHSLVTEDKVENDDISQLSKSAVFTPTFNGTTSGKNSINALMEYSLKKGFSVKAEYNRVDKGYQSFGTAFVTNDIENYVVGVNASIFKRSVTIGTSIGIQRDNISQQSINSTNRFIGSGSLNMTLGKKFNSNLTYSNFNTIQVKDVTREIVDAGALNISDVKYLSFINQVSQNASMGLTYNFGEKTVIPVGLIFSYQKAKEIRNAEIVNESENEFYSIGISTSYAIGETGVALTFGIVGSENRTFNGSFQSLTPTIGSAANLFDKLIAVTASISYSTSYLNSESDKSLFAFQTGVNVLKLKNHKIGLRARIISQKGNPSPNLPAIYNESTINLTYGYKIVGKIDFQKKWVDKQW